MALQPKILEEELIKMSEGASNNMIITYSDLVGAVEKYAYSLQYPPPVGVKPASEILKKILDLIPTSPPLPVAVPIIKLALQLFAFGIALGKPINGPGGPVPGTGSGVFPTRPPSGQPNIDSIFNQPNSPEIFAKQLSLAIHSWFMTGQYDGVGYVQPTSGGPVPRPGPTPWT